MSDSAAPPAVSTPAPASVSARPDVGMVFHTLLASGDQTTKVQP